MAGTILARRAEKRLSPTGAVTDNADLKALIRTIPDFPRAGIQFRDITTLLLDPAGFAAAIERLAGRVGELRSDTAAWTRRSAASLAPDSNGRAYQGYAEAGRPDWAGACHGPRLARLLAIRAKYDPDGLFRRSAVPVRDGTGTSPFTGG